MGMIYKYELTGTNTLQLREGSVVMHVGEQNGKLYLWATVDLDAKLRPLTFVVISTGSHVPSDFPHIGTVQMCDGIVVHVFLAKEPTPPETRE